MSQTDYVRLVERMNQNEAKHVQTDSLLKFVKETL